MAGTAFILFCPYNNQTEFPLETTVLRGQFNCQKSCNVSTGILTHLSDSREGVHSTALHYFQPTDWVFKHILENNLILLIITHVSLLIYGFVFARQKSLKFSFLKFSYSVMYHYENLNFRKQSASISREATLYFLSSLSEIRKTLYTVL